MSRLKILKIYVVFWLFIFFLLYANFDKVVVFFLSSLTFNIAVLTMLAIGTVVIVGAAIKLTMLTGSFSILRYKKGAELQYYLKTLRGTFPEDIANLLEKRVNQTKMTFSKDDIAQVNEWMEEKSHNEKVYINFFIGTSLMLGLLGTFVGLLTAIEEMSGIVLSLSGDINLAEVIQGFSGPISGMATGFGSSLFGVTSAIILSVKGYILNRNEEIFLVEVKDWMNSLQQTSVDMSNATPEEMIRSFAQTSITLAENMEKLTHGNETMVGMLSSGMEEESSSRKIEVKILEGISNALRELNINQYQSSTAIDESLQELSSATINGNTAIKSMLELQEKNNKLLEELIRKLDQKSRV